MIEVISSVYVSYRGDSERHVLRLAIMILAAVALTAGGENLTTAAFPSMALAITVLAGFSFTALFSSHALVVHDLPEIRDEEDRRDIKRLTVLSENFRIRSRYFLIFAVIDLLLIIWLNVDFDFNFITDLEVWRAVDHYIGGGVQFFWTTLSVANLLAFRFLIFISVMMFLEGVYTFYRLAQTIMAVLDLRSSYLQSRFDIE